MIKFDGIPVTVSIGDSPSLLCNSSCDEDVINEQDSSKYSGTSENNTINGRGSDDIIKSGVGADSIVGKGGSDVINGQRGHDTLSGGFGFDTISGGAGDDIIYGGQCINTLSGGSGSDVFHLENGGTQVLTDFDPLKDQPQVASDINRDDLSINKKGEVVFGDNVLAQIS